MEYFSKFIINKKALLSNLNNLPTKNICAMVKADAYGHNIETVCKILKNKVSFFGVANMEEALRIRKVDKESKILIVGYCNDIELAVKHNISLTVNSFKQLEIINKNLKKRKSYQNKKIKKQFFKKENSFSLKAKKSINNGKKIDYNLQTNKIDTKKLCLHIKINSGMNRLGISDIQELKKCIKIFLHNKNLCFEGIYTHFSTLDCDKAFFYKQFKKFKSLINEIPSFFNPIKHIGGGAVIENLNKKELDLYMVRVGYKLYTTPNSVLTITSKIIKIHELKYRDRVGYSNGYVCDKKTKIAVIPLGYADGINRLLSYKTYKTNKTYKTKSKNNCKLKNNTFIKEDNEYKNTKNFNTNIYVKINGKKALIVGNVCMDMFFVDVTNIKCNVFDEVIVYDGKTLNKWALKCLTIPYEILTSLNYERMKFTIK